MWRTSQFFGGFTEIAGRCTEKTVQVNSGVGLPGFLTTKDTKVTKDFKDKEFPCVSDVLSGNKVFLENLSEIRVNMLFLCDLRALQGELRSKTR